MKYIGPMFICMLALLFASITYIAVDSDFKQNEPIAIEITYFDGKTEILTTSDHNRGYVTIVRNGCTVNIYDYSRCGVKKVTIIKQ